MHVSVGGRDDGRGMVRTWLLAVVAKALGRGANLGVVANIATLVAGTARQGRHGDESVDLKGTMSARHVT